MKKIYGLVYGGDDYPADCSEVGWFLSFDKAIDECVRLNNQLDPDYVYFDPDWREDDYPDCKDGQYLDELAEKDEKGEITEEFYCQEYDRIMDKHSHKGMTRQDALYWYKTYDEPLYRRYLVVESDLHE